MDGNDKQNQEAIDLNKAQFGREAAKYSVSRIHSNHEDLDFAAKLIGPENHWKCLDIATGAGHLAHKLAQYTESVVASDLTSQMLHEAEKLAHEKSIPNITFEEFDVHSIPHDENQFDLVMSRIAPHHFYDISLAISEMIRVTKTGRYIFIQDTLSPETNTASNLLNEIEILRDSSHKRDLTEDEWSRQFLENNCDILKIEKQQKMWPLRWWTERMSTPSENVLKIVKLLEDNYEEFKDDIGIILHSKDYDDDWSLDKKIDVWEITPNNIYLLARKKQTRLTTIS